MGGTVSVSSHWIYNICHVDVAFEKNLYVCVCKDLLVVCVCVCTSATFCTRTIYYVLVYSTNTFLARSFDMFNIGAYIGMSHVTGSSTQHTRCTPLSHSLFFSHALALGSLLSLLSRIVSSRACDIFLSHFSVLSS